MSDVVVTVPMRKWAEWLEEGDLAHGSYGGSYPEPRRGLQKYQYEFHYRGYVPNIAMGERVYVVAWGRLRGWAPLEDLQVFPYAFHLIRGPGEHARPVTIPETIRGFQGWRYRWWELTKERPFPDWKTLGVPE